MITQTRYRIAVLEALDAGKPKPTTDFLAWQESSAARMAATLPGSNGQPRMPARHAEGKWYFEVTIDRAAASKAGARS